MIALRQEWSDDCQALIEWLALQRAAILPMADLPKRLGIPSDELEPILAEARAADLVVDWQDAPVGPSLMLSTRAADHLGLELVAPSHQNIGTKRGCRSVRWVPRGDARSERADEGDEVLESVVFGADGSLDEQIDRGAGDPAVAASRAEDALRRAAQHNLMRQAELARWSPLVILGVRQTWPIAHDPDGRCGACHGRRLERTTFCLWCQRSGVDALLEPVPRRVQRHAYRPGRLPGGKGGEPRPSQNSAKVAAPKPKLTKARRKAKVKPRTMAELTTVTPPPKSAWRAERDQMKAAAKGK